MVEHRPWLTYLTHAILILGCLFIAFPIYTTFVASTHRLDDITSYFPLLPGRQLIENYQQALTVGSGEVVETVWTMLMNSAIMAFGIAFGKIFISLLSAFAIVYFRFRFRMLFFPAGPVGGILFTNNALDSIFPYALTYLLGQRLWYFFKKHQQRDKGRKFRFNGTTFDVNERSSS